MNKDLIAENLTPADYPTLAYLNSVVDQEELKPLKELYINHWSKIINQLKFEGDDHYRLVALTDLIIQNSEWKNMEITLKELLANAKNNFTQHNNPDTKSYYEKIINLNKAFSAGECNLILPKDQIFMP